MKLWVVRFRYLSPDSYLDDDVYTPIEQTKIKAETQKDAWNTFLKKAFPTPIDRFQQVEVYED